MSDRDRGRGHGGFHGGVRPPRGVPPYGYNQSNGIITYIDRAEPAGTASMVADGVNPSERHPTSNRHGQWEHNAEFSYMQHARDALPLLQTPHHVRWALAQPRLVFRALLASVLTARAHKKACFCLQLMYRYGNRLFFVHLR